MAINWDPKMSVGVRLIDEQHQELFRRVNALLDLMKHGKGESSIAELFSFLQEYVVEHFGAEQALMANSGYPGYESHRAQHDDFVAVFVALRSTFQKTGPTTSILLKLNRTVCNWLIEHIGTSDLALGKFLGTAVVNRSRVADPA